MNPQYDDEEPINPFHPVTGANFKLKIRTVDRYRNYDKSEVDSPSPITEDDDEWERIEKSIHPLQQFLDPSNFKSYDELKAKLDKVLGLTNTTSTYKPDKPVNKPTVTSSKIEEEDDNLDDILNSLKDDDI